MREIILIAYFFRESDGVSSARSRCLYKLLKERNFIIECLSKYTWGKFISKSNFLWGLMCFFYLLKTEKKLVYISCGPFWYLPIICLVCRLKRIKFVVDFRDPWSLNVKNGYGNPDKKPSNLKVWLTESIEKIIYKYCEYFIVCTPGMHKAYRKLFKDSAKIHVVLNGFDFSLEDLELFKQESYDDNYECLRLVCIGKFAEYSEMKARRVLEQLKKYVSEHGSNSLLLEFIGTSKEPTSRLIKEFGLEKNTIFYPKMPYNQAIKIAAKADLGLCIIRDENFDFGTKVFDYIGLGIPILNSFDKRLDFYSFFGKYICELNDVNKINMKSLSWEESAMFKREAQLMKLVELFCS